MSSAKPLALIGYSGHAYVVCDAFASRGQRVAAYSEQSEKVQNPFGLRYLGHEQQADVLQQLRQYSYFVAIGDNRLRKTISLKLQQHLGAPLNALHADASISPSASLQAGVLVGPRAVINALARLEQGVICNSGAIIEHECEVGAWAHIAPGAILCGNVRVGQETLVGAGAVVRPGITIGRGACIGSGAVITRDVADGAVVVGHGRVINLIPCPSPPEKGTGL